MFFQLFALLGPASIAFTLIILALLSRRLGSVTRAKPYYRIFYLAAFMICMAVFVEFVYIISPDTLSTLRIFAILVEQLLFAIAITISLVTAWYYWSWLLAERA
ncbi:hypothetical protein MASR2M15_24920 [Anaerolineales bacterium]